MGEEDRIIMDYFADEADLYAIEYQIATDDKFTKIVHVRIIMGSDYKPLEYIEMNDGTITNETVYYIRARRHCSASVVSAWSNIVSFRSGKWNTQKFRSLLLTGNYDLDKNYLSEWNYLEERSSFKYTNSADRKFNLPERWYNSCGDRKFNRI
ncbi:hypothetical protein [Chryseobacterium indoltheticum]|uniref:hypothetical protein n=1 Tax=Chryseobacterium indoltheticum TaxID=254 RepID=UPI003F497A7D